MWQTRLIAKLKEVKGDNGEALCFALPLGFIRLVFVVHIPCEGETESVVFCKCVDPRKGRPNA